MQPCLHIGGDKDSLIFPVPDDAETVTWPVAVTDKETYNRSTLSVGDASVTFYRHESLTSAQARDRLRRCQAFGFRLAQPGADKPVRCPSRFKCERSARLRPRKVQPLFFRDSRQMRPKE